MTRETSLHPVTPEASHVRASAPDDGAFGALVELLRGRPAVALVGAGCSTESGIPDYRGPDGSLRHRQPMQYGEFVRSPEGRARYWSRSAIGWPRISAARPNAAHDALARLERTGALAGVVTQNVDGLHQAAGSRRVVELHGTLALVRCLGCGRAVTRQAFQERLLAENPGSGEHPGADPEDSPSAPDGDAEARAEDLAAFHVPDCGACGGVLKPDVVFFGESVPRESVEAARALVDAAEVLLVLGSSLAVFSGRRFVYAARDAGKPVAVVNLGPTRADELATVRVEGRLGRVLPRLADELAPRATPDAILGDRP